MLNHSLFSASGKPSGADNLIETIDTLLKKPYLTWSVNDSVRFKYALFNTQLVGMGKAQFTATALLACVEAQDSLHATIRFITLLAAWGLARFQSNDDLCKTLLAEMQISVIADAIKGAISSEENSNTKDLTQCFQEIQSFKGKIAVLMFEKVRQVIHDLIPTALPPLEQLQAKITMSENTDDIGERPLPALTNAGNDAVRTLTAGSVKKILALKLKDPLQWQAINAVLTFSQDPTVLSVQSFKIFEGLMLGWPAFSERHQESPVLRLQYLLELQDSVLRLNAVPTRGDAFVWSATWVQVRAFLANGIMEDILETLPDTPQAHHLRASAMVLRYNVSVTLLNLCYENEKTHVNPTFRGTFRLLLGVLFAYDEGLMLYHQGGEQYLSRFVAQVFNSLPNSAFMQKLHQLFDSDDLVYPKLILQSYLAPREPLKQTFMSNPITPWVTAALCGEPLQPSQAAFEAYAQDRINAVPEPTKQLLDIIRPLWQPTAVTTRQRFEAAYRLQQTVASDAVDWPTASLRKPLQGTAHIQTEAIEHLMDWLRAMQGTAQDKRVALQRLQPNLDALITAAANANEVHITSLQRVSAGLLSLYALELSERSNMTVISTKAKDIVLALLKEVYEDLKHRALVEGEDYAFIILAQWFLSLSAGKLGAGLLKEAQPANGTEDQPYALVGHDAFVETLAGMLTLSSALTEEDTVLLNRLYDTMASQRHFTNLVRKAQMLFVVYPMGLANNTHPHRHSRQFISAYLQCFTIPAPKDFLSLFQVTLRQLTQPAALKSNLKALIQRAYLFDRVEYYQQHASPMVSANSFPVDTLRPVLAVSCPAAEQEAMASIIQLLNQSSFVMALKSTKKLSAEAIWLAASQTRERILPEQSFQQTLVTFYAGIRLWHSDFLQRVVKDDPEKALGYLVYLDTLLEKAVESLPSQKKSNGEVTAAWQPQYHLFVYLRQQLLSAAVIPLFKKVDTRKWDDVKQDHLHGFARQQARLLYALAKQQKKPNYDAAMQAAITALRLAEVLAPALQEEKPDLITSLVTQMVGMPLAKEAREILSRSALANEKDPSSALFAPKNSVCCPENVASSSDVKLQWPYVQVKKTFLEKQFFGLLLANLQWADEMPVLDMPNSASHAMPELNVFSYIPVRDYRRVMDASRQQSVQKVFDTLYASLLPDHDPSSGTLSESLQGTRAYFKMGHFLKCCFSEIYHPSLAEAQFWFDLGMRVFQEKIYHTVEPLWILRLMCLVKAQQRYLCLDAEEQAKAPDFQRHFLTAVSDLLDIETVTKGSIKDHGVFLKRQLGLAQQTAGLPTPGLDTSTKGYGDWLLLMASRMMENSVAAGASISSKHYEFIFSALQLGLMLRSDDAQQGLVRFLDLNNMPLANTNEALASKSLIMAVLTLEEMCKRVAAAVEKEQGGLLSRIEALTELSNKPTAFAKTIQAVLAVFIRIRQAPDQVFQIIQETHGPKVYPMTNALEWLVSDVLVNRGNATSLGRGLDNLLEMGFYLYPSRQLGGCPVDIVGRAYPEGLHPIKDLNAFKSAPLSALGLKVLGQFFNGNLSGGVAALVQVDPVEWTPIATCIFIGKEYAVKERAAQILTTLNITMKAFPAFLAHLNKEDLNQHLSLLNHIRVLYQILIQLMGDETTQENLPSVHIWRIAMILLTQGMIQPLLRRSDTLLWGETARYNLQMTYLHLLQVSYALEKEKTGTDFKETIAAAIAVLCVSGSGNALLTAQAINTFRDDVFSMLSLSKLDTQLQAAIKTAFLDPQAPVGQILLNLRADPFYVLNRVTSALIVPHYREGSPVLSAGNSVKGKARIGSQSPGLDSPFAHIVVRNLWSFTHGMQFNEAQLFQACFEQYGEKIEISPTLEDYSLWLGLTDQQDEQRKPLKSLHTLDALSAVLKALDTEDHPALWAAAAATFKTREDLFELLDGRSDFQAVFVALLLKTWDSASRTLKVPQAENALGIMPEEALVSLCLRVKTLLQAVLHLDTGGLSEGLAQKLQRFIGGDNNDLTAFASAWYRQTHQTLYRAVSFVAQEVHIIAEVTGHLDTTGQALLASTEYAEAGKVMIWQKPHVKQDPLALDDEGLHILEDFAKDSQAKVQLESHLCLATWYYYLASLTHAAQQNTGASTALSTAIGHLWMFMKSLKLFNEVGFVNAEDKTYYFNRGNNMAQRSLSFFHSRIGTQTGKQEAANNDIQSRSPDHSLVEKAAELEQVICSAKNNP